MTTPVIVQTNDIQQYANLYTACGNFSPFPTSTGSTKNGIWDYYPTNITVLNPLTNPSTTTTQQLIWTGNTPQTITDNDNNTLTVTTGSLLSNQVLTGPKEKIIVPLVRQQANLMIQDPYAGTASVDGTVPGVTPITIPTLNLSYYLRFSNPLTCSRQIASNELYFPSTALNVTYYNSQTLYQPIQFDGTVTGVTTNQNIYVLISVPLSGVVPSVYTQIQAVSTTNYTFTSLPGSDTSLLTVTIPAFSTNVTTSGTYTGSANVPVGVTLFSTFYPLLGDQVM